MPARHRHKKRRASPHHKLWQRVSLLVVGIVFAGVFYYYFLQPYIYRWKYSHSTNQYGIAAPDGYQICGIDVSRYQKTIDWSALVENIDEKYPIYFVFVKATEGGNYRDPLFEKNFRDAKRHGFLRGAYHFFSPSVAAALQARNFINTVPLQSGDFPPILDVETIGSLSTQELRIRVLEWLRIVEQHYGVKPIIYAGWKFKERHLDTPDFNDYPYWIAHYYVDKVKYKGKWHFWQYTDIATIPGIDAKTDMNIFNGTREQLAEMLIK